MKKILLIIALVLVVISGYFQNIYKLTTLDFEPNYKAETVRIIGIVIPPVGLIVGWVTFDEEVEHSSR